MNFLIFSKHERKEYKYSGGGGGREKRLSRPSSLDREALTPGLGKQALPNLPGGGGKGAPGRSLEPDGLRSRLHPCRHQQEEKPAAPPGMTLEGQPIRRGAAPGAATSEKSRTHGRRDSPASPKGGMQVHQRRAPQAPDTPFPLLCTFWILRYRSQHGPSL